MNTIFVSESRYVFFDTRMKKHLVCAEPKHNDNGLILQTDEITGICSQGHKRRLHYKKKVKVP